MGHSWDRPEAEKACMCSWMYQFTPQLAEAMAVRLSAAWMMTVIVTPGLVLP